jgi:solute carrier family 13 (sodium-dependent dicarboxylate transporter), member 2/3/5
MYYRGMIGISPAIRQPARRAVCGFAIAWMSFFAILLWLPLPEGLSPAGKAALATMIWASVVWVSEAIPTAVSGILIPALLVLSGAVPTFSAAAGGFSAPVVFLCLTAFIFAAIMQIAGLDHRIALYLLHKFKARTANGVIWSLFGVNLLLSLIVPAANARSAALLPVTNGITALFGDTPAERNAKKAIVIQTLVYGSMIGGMCILTAHLPNVVVAALIEKQFGVRISYADWLRLQWPYLGMFALTQLWVQFYFKSRSVPVPGGREAIERERAALAPMKSRDYAILAVFCLIAVLWATEQLHGLTTESVALIGLAILFIPGLLDMRWQEIQDRTIWGTLFLLAGALSLSAAIGSSGLAAWLAEHLYAVAANRPWWSMLMLFMAGTHVVRLGMLSNVASVTLMAPIVMALAPKLGLHPVAFTLLVSDTDSFAYLLPTQITAGVIAYSSGTFTMSDYAKVGIVSVAIAILYGTFIMAPWYAAMGIPLWNPGAPWPLGHIHG